MRNNSRLWIGLIIGVTVGAGLAILITSDEGKEFIEEVKEDLKDTAGKAEKEVKRAISNLEETLNKGKEIAGRLEKKAGKLIKQSSR